MFSSPTGAFLISIMFESGMINEISFSSPTGAFLISI